MFVTGTDTGVGKSVASAWLVRRLEAAYWKPVQSGLEEETDPEFVRRVADVDAGRIHPCAFALPEPLSPHEAARRAGVRITLAAILERQPDAEGPLVVEGAGGVMVPLNDEGEMMIDLMAALGLPVVVVCRTTLGTINHTLLALEALRRRGLRVAGLVLNGPDMPHNRRALEHFGRVPVLAHLPLLERLDAASLDAVQPETDLRMALA